MAKLVAMLKIPFKISAKTKALAAVNLVVCIWGFSLISTKTSLGIYSPIMTGLIRHGLALLFMLPMLLIDNKKNYQRDASLRIGHNQSVHNQTLKKRFALDLKSAFFLFIAGFVGITLYFVFENNGIMMVSVSEAAICIGTVPVLSLVADWLFDKISRKKTKSEIKKRQWIGASISIIGAAFVSGAGIIISGSVLGYLFMLLSVISWVAYCFLTRVMFTRLSRIKIVFYQTLFGFIGFFPFALAEGFHLPPPTLEVALHLLFLSVFCSAIGYALYVYALDKLGTPRASIFINMIPVVAVAAGFFLMGDRLSQGQWLGAALVLLGVYLGSG